jgi:hypothetical protein
MSTVENQEVFQRAVDNWNTGDLAAYLEMYDPQVVLHGFPPDLPSGAEGANLFYHGLWAAFPQPRLIIHDMLSDEEKLACRFEMEATHQGIFMGLPPTGKFVHVSGMAILRFANRKCVERWNQVDMLGWLQQLGVIPTPE